MQCNGIREIQFTVTPDWPHARLCKYVRHFNNRGHMNTCLQRITVVSNPLQDLLPGLDKLNILLKQVIDKV